VLLVLLGVSVRIDRNGTIRTFGICPDFIRFFFYEIYYPKNYNGQIFDLRGTFFTVMFAQKVT